MHTSLIANEQPQTQLAFQLLNLAAQGRLADVQPLGGAGKIQFARQLHKVAKLPKFHRRIVTYGNRIPSNPMARELFLETGPCTAKQACSRVGSGRLVACLIALYLIDITTISK